MENLVEQEDANEMVPPNALSADHDETAPVHKLDNLKMTQIRATAPKGELDPSQNEWTVVYSESNSSVLSGIDDIEDEDEVCFIDIFVVPLWQFNLCFCRQSTFL